MTRLHRAVTWLLDNFPVLILAGIAAVGSFTHIRETAAQHGQHGWMADTVAVSIDLTCVMAARERRRDSRLGRRHRGLLSWPTVVLGSGIVLSLAANLAQAQPTPWGWVIAGTPAASFLVAVSMLERRADAPRTAPHQTPASSADAIVHQSAHPAGTAPVRVSADSGADVPQPHAERAEHPAQPAPDLGTLPYGQTRRTVAAALADADVPHPHIRESRHEQTAEPVVADAVERPGIASGNVISGGNAAAAQQVNDEVAAMRLSRQTRTALPAGIRLDEVTETITYPHPDSGEPPPETPHEPLHQDAEPPAREELVAELADQIRADPSGWRPDYPALMARTGMKRRWCESLVRDARTTADQPRTPVRTGGADDHLARTFEENL